MSLGCCSSLLWAAGAALALLVAVIVKFMRSDADFTMQRHSVIPAGAFVGKVVWIAGASTGIGAALARVMAAHGATLVLSARTESALRKVAEECEAAGSPKAHVVCLDYLEVATHAAVAAAVVKLVTRVDYFVNNAGRSQRAIVEETETDVDRAMFDLNVIGCISLTKALLPHLLRQPGGGHIMVTSSVAGKVPSPCSATYAATKHALQGFYNTLRAELADRDVGVTLVCPGPVDSDITRNFFGAKLGAAVDVSKDESRRMTGGRCAELMAAAAYHRLPEVWLSNQPILAFVYIYQYAPWLGVFLASRVGPKRVAAFRAGNTGYSSVQSWGAVLAGGGDGKKKDV